MDDLCECLRFVLWYEEDGWRVCRCGHRSIEHLDGDRSCVGEVVKL